jgi:hydrogenase maturation protease
MQQPASRILIYGYGNPGRQDDALGILLSGEIEKWAQQNKLTNIEVEQNYQLNIEDAEKISHFEVVIFADASMNEIESFSFGRLEPDLLTEFSMHSVKPSFVLGLCEEIFEHSPHAYLLRIRGYKWELIEKISPKAKKNLLASIDFLKMIIEEKREL